MKLWLSTALSHVLLPVLSTGLAGQYSHHIRLCNLVIWWGIILSNTIYKLKLQVTEHLFKD